MSKKILILHDYYSRATSVGGHHVYADLLLQFLHTKSHSSRSSFSDNLIPLFLRSTQGPLKFLFAFFRELGFILSTHDLIVVFNSVFSPECFLLFILSVLIGRKCFVIPHGMLSVKRDKSLDTISSFKGCLKYLYSRVLFSLPVNFIATSGLEKSFLESCFFPLNPICVMPPASFYFPPSVNLPPPILESYLQPDLNVFTILSSGRITPSKGSEVLFDVFEALANLLPTPIRLIVLGPVASCSAFKHISGLPHSNNLHVFDSCYNLAEFKALSLVSDLFLTCSPSESFGMCIYEALSFGLPTVCSLGTPWHSLSSFSAGLCVSHSVSSYIEAVSYFISLSSSERQLFSANAKVLSAKVYCDNKSIPSSIFNF